MLSRKKVLGVVVFLLTVSATAGYMSRPKWPAALTVAEPIRDFGEIAQGELLEANFELRNGYADTVEIQNIFESCDCAVAEISSKMIEPRQTATLKFIWKVGSRRGAIETSVMLVYRQGNDTPRRATLTLRANAIPDFDYEPPSLRFQAHRTQTLTLRLKPAPGNDTIIREAYSTQRAFTCSVSTDRCTVDVQFRPADWSSDLTSAYLVLETTSRREPRCQIALTVDP